MPEDIIRVFRMLEYVGPRSLVEEQIARSIHGTKVLWGNNDGEDVTVTATTLGEWPEILKRGSDNAEVKEEASQEGSTEKEHIAETCDIKDCERCKKQAEIVKRLDRIYDKFS